MQQSVRYKKIEERLLQLLQLFGYKIQVINISTDVIALTHCLSSPEGEFMKKMKTTLPARGIYSGQTEQFFPPPL